MEPVIIKGIEINDAVIKNIAQMADNIDFAILLEEMTEEQSPKKLIRIIELSFGEELSKEIWERCDNSMSEVASFFKQVQAAALSPPEPVGLSTVSRWE